MILAVLDPGAAEIVVAVVSGPLMAWGVQRLAKRADAKDGRAAALDARDALLWTRMEDALKAAETEINHLNSRITELEHELTRLKGTP